MKTIKVTHIDTGGHGYLSVSKADFLEVCSVLAISGYSGHSLNRMYLEEDCDATKFFDACKAQGIEVEVKSSYNLHFKCTHNYKPALFAYAPVLYQEVEIDGNGWFTITDIQPTKIIVTGQGLRYQIPLSNLFGYIIACRTPEMVTEEA